MGKNLVLALCALSALLITHQAYAAAKFKEVASDKKYQGAVSVSQEGVGNVPVSSTDINRIVSDHLIYHIKLPEDASIMAEIDTTGGKNAFLQYKGKKTQTIYVSTKGGVYTLRIKPAAIGAQKIHLVGNVSNSVSKLYGNKREKLAVDIIKAAFSKGKLLEKARKSRRFRHRRLIKDIIIKEHRRYDFEEDHLTLNVYIVKLADSFKYPKFKVTEKSFLIPDLTNKPMGIALSRDYLTKNDYVRLFILGRN